LKVSVLGDDNQAITPYMGCYGIGVNRIVASAIEVIDGNAAGHDEQGIIWPRSIAPYDVLLCSLQNDPESQTVAIAHRIAASLEAKGFEVLVDDRDERPGVKFKDADLIGIPLRITVGERGLAEGNVEVKARDGSNGPKGDAVPLERVVIEATKLLSNMR
jgi:prolyl-tRNA synthetase